jgi:peptidoglycan L-alanyl-D-glutamate endopeptidase CwlK
MALLFESPVFLFFLTAYGLAIVVGSWLVMHVERRRQWQRRVQSSFSAANRRLGVRIAEAVQNASSVPSRTVVGCRLLKATLVRHRQPVIITAAILAIPTILAYLFAPHGTLDVYDDQLPATDPVIVALLRGEQLVPPPALPPDAFLGRDIEAERHEIATASREWAVLDIDFRQRLLTVFQMMSRHGYQMTLIEGYRSPQRQELLARRGAHVTNAGAYQSYHQYGLAADSAFYRAGKVVLSERDPWAMEGYRLYGKYAESVGLVWGGRWQMMDLGHVELRKPDVLRQ